MCVCIVRRVLGRLSSTHRHSGRNGSWRGVLLTITESVGRRRRRSWTGRARAGSCWAAAGTRDGRARAIETVEVKHGKLPSKQGQEWDVPVLPRTQCRSYVLAWPPSATHPCLCVAISDTLKRAEAMGGVFNGTCSVAGDVDSQSVCQSSSRRFTSHPIGTTDRHGQHRASLVENPSLARL